MNDLLNKDPIETDESIDYVAELTGPGKKFDKSKFKDDTELLQAISKSNYHADRMIKFKNDEFDKLNQDFLKVRNELSSGQSLKELLDQYDLKRTQPNPPPVQVTEQSTFDPKQVEVLVTNKLQEHEATKRQQDNYNLVVSKLKERYGNSYQSTLEEQMSELDMTREELNRMARTQPKTFIRTFGLDREPTRQDFQSPPRSDARSDNFSPKHQLRTWSYYEKLRKEQPDLYRTPRIQSQMLRDADQLGEKFQDGTWDSLGKL